MKIGRSALAIELDRVEIIREPAGSNMNWVETLESHQVHQFLDFASKTTKKIRDYFSIAARMEFWDNKNKRHMLWNLPGNLIYFEGKKYDISPDLDIS